MKKEQFILVQGVGFQHEFYKIKIKLKLLIEIVGSLVEKAGSSVENACSSVGIACSSVGIAGCIVRILGFAVVIAGFLVVILVSLVLITADGEVLTVSSAEELIISVPRVIEALVEVKICTLAFCATDKFTEFILTFSDEFFPGITFDCIDFLKAPSSDCNADLSVAVNRESLSAGEAVGTADSPATAFTETGENSSSRPDVLLFFEFDLFELDSQIN